jgi:hypothetical protein
LGWRSHHQTSSALAALAGKCCLILILD